MLRTMYRRWMRLYKKHPVFFEIVGDVLGLAMFVWVVYMLFLVQWVYELK